LSDSHAIGETSLAIEHEARPELRHHFADEEQQRNAASLGMWWFLGTEIMFFGGMFCGYLVYRRIYFPEFAVASRSLDLIVGTLNTAVLICSSLTVAQSVRAAQLGNRKLQVRLLLATIFFGLVFLGVKGYEWRNKYEEHHIPTFDYNVIGGKGDLIKANAKFLGIDKLQNDPVKLRAREAQIQDHTKVFYSLYFALTGMHALHMVVGVGIFSVITFMAWRGKFTPEYHTPLEIAGLYWHFVDIVWIYLFPLLYLIDRRPGA
jgi:cytochrome c oxidase subunit III